MRPRQYLSPKQILRLLISRRIPPTRITVTDHLRIKGLRGRFFLPDRMRVEGAFHIVDCPDFDTLPMGLSVRESLLVQDCPSLTTIPPDLHVSNILFLDRHQIPPDKLMITGLYGNGDNDLQILRNSVAVPQLISDAFCNAVIGRPLGDLIDHSHLRWRRTCDREVIGFRQSKKQTIFLLKPVGAGWNHWPAKEEWPSEYPFITNWTEN